MISKAVLEGGPDDLTERVVPLSADDKDELKVPHRGGFEHFRPTAREKDLPEGRLPVWEWWERTEIAE